jgi:hypothetical protein
MFLRATIRRKDGKEHRYWSPVENKRVSGGGVVQRHVLYLGEINSSQELAWRKSIEVLEDGADRPRSLALFSGGSLRRRAARRFGGAAQADAGAAEPPAPMGRVLAGRAALGGTAARPLLERSAAGEPQGHALESGAAGADGVPADRAGRGVETAGRSKSRRHADIKVLFVIFSSASFQKHWLHFEAGTAWIRKVPIMVLTHSGLKPSELPSPYSSFQGCGLDEPQQLRLLLDDVAGAAALVRGRFGAVCG